MAGNSHFREALRTVARVAQHDATESLSGNPADPLQASIRQLLGEAAAPLTVELAGSNEAQAPNRPYQSGYAVYLQDVFAGYVGFQPTSLPGKAGRQQRRAPDWSERCPALPNVLCTNGTEWTLLRNGRPAGSAPRAAGAFAPERDGIADPEKDSNTRKLLRDFLNWEPAIALDRDGRVVPEGLAATLAVLCRTLRDDLRDALARNEKQATRVAREWRRLGPYGATDSALADSYAQTVTFALLLGRSEGAEPMSIRSAHEALANSSSLLSLALQTLADSIEPHAWSAALQFLLRVIGAVPVSALTDCGMLWLRFYEDFLAAYDPLLRKSAGVYYTPIAVVRAQVRLIEALLIRRLDKPLGYADPEVATLDPATGTGTYLLAVIEQAAKRAAQVQGLRLVPNHATDLARRLHGLELMAGPCAVTEFRVSRALLDHGARLPANGVQVRIADTLEGPEPRSQRWPLFQPKANPGTPTWRNAVSASIRVCLGNPPYGRHEASSGNPETSLGGSVRQGVCGNGPSLRAFIDPARAAGQAIHVKNLYNLYIYFWRWALWKVFEEETARGPGIVSFVTASSYLDGNAFCGMREHMRRVCDEIWILDLGGEGRGSQPTENVFAIRTPVAVAVAFRAARPERSRPATVRYARLDGTRAQKLARLSEISDFEAVDWRACPVDWWAPFRPIGKGTYFSWPLLTDLMPWQHSGVQCKRTWPIAPDRATLERRWRQLLFAEDRARAFRETEDRKVAQTYKVPLTGQNDPQPIAELHMYAQCPDMRSYAWRSFDRRWILADGRLISRPRPDLWRAHGNRQLYFASLLTKPLGSGPALVATADMPDLDSFSGRGAKDVIPLYRSADASDANILPGLLDLLGKEYGRPVSPEDFAAYIYGLVAQSAFTERFSAQLESRQLRVPLTRERSLFKRVQAAGLRLLWLHTWAERFVPAGESLNRVPPGPSKCTKGIPVDPEGYPRSFRFDPETGILHVGAGEFAPVRREVYEFEISGLRVLPAWLRARMKGGSGRKSSPLDEIGPEIWTAQFTTELLQLIWVLEYTLNGYPAQRELLEAVIESDCFRVSDLPTVPDERRMPPRTRLPRVPSLRLPDETCA